MLRLWTVSAAVLLLAACDQSRDPVEAGRLVYAANCSACHSLDPHAEGVLGPAVAGSSRELIEARLLRAEYPEGYQPKRDTQQMAALVFLAPQIDVLAAYLGSLD